MLKRRKLLAAMAAVFAGCAVPSVHAQGDNQPVRIVIGFAPGASTDTLARLLADRMRTTLGVPVVVENKPGASTRTAVEAVKRAAPDGRTLLITPVAPMSIFPSMYKSLRYDPVADFEPVSHLVNFQYGIAVNPETPIASLKDLVAWTKAHPAQANYSTPGNGTVPHLFGVMFAKKLELPLVHISYKGSTPALTDVVGGQLPMIITSEVDLIEMHKAGKIRVIATAGKKRSAYLPDVPTFKEAGYPIEGTGWYGMYAPAKTPKDTVQKISQAAVAALKDPEVSGILAKLGMEATGTAPADLAAIQKADAAQWGPVVTLSGFQPDQ